VRRRPPRRARPGSSTPGGESARGARSAVRGDDAALGASVFSVRSAVNPPVPRSRSRRGPRSREAVRRASAQLARVLGAGFSTTERTEHTETRSSSPGVTCVPEHQSCARPALDRQVSIVEELVVLRTEQDEVIERVWAAVFLEDEVMDVDEAKVPATGDDAAMMVARKDRANMSLFSSLKSGVAWCLTQSSADALGAAFRAFGRSIGLRESKYACHSIVRPAHAVFFCQWRSNESSKISDREGVVGMMYPRSMGIAVAVVVLAVIAACGSRSVGDSCADDPCLDVSFTDATTGAAIDCLLPQLECSSGSLVLSCCEGLLVAADPGLRCRDDALVFTSTVFTLCGVRYTIGTRAE